MKYTVTPANVFESIWHISILPEYPNDQGRARTITISARKPDLIDWLDHSIEEWGRSLERDDQGNIYDTFEYMHTHLFRTSEPLTAVTLIKQRYFGKIIHGDQMVDVTLSDLVGIRGEL